MYFAYLLTTVLAWKQDTSYRFAPHLEGVVHIKVDAGSQMNLDEETDVHIQMEAGLHFIRTLRSPAISAFAFSRLAWVIGKGMGVWGVKTLPFGSPTRVSYVRESTCSSLFRRGDSTGITSFHRQTSSCINLVLPLAYQR